ncbi:hypothetical protein [Chelatococcus reniformis]|uniref:Uncharacterized protein n=1 Tax=Chelatococcus reniformis TaxID=1494448 RepID=A0A916XGP4_9HYPH|nr:hypothetical protein [Chelatococcus reniformis]GGC70527.1 hypothetical protein GCM10010994_31330 [Chelatococcus reniformis]
MSAVANSVIIVRMSRSLALALRLARPSGPPPEAPGTRMLAADQWGRVYAWPLAAGARERS